MRGFLVFGEMLAHVEDFAAIAAMICIGGHGLSSTRRGAVGRIRMPNGGWRHVGLDASAAAEFVREPDA
jgi:hypothetical protein